MGEDLGGSGLLKKKQQRTRRAHQLKATNNDQRYKPTQSPTITTARNSNKEEKKSVVRE